MPTRQQRSNPPVRTKVDGLTPHNRRELAKLDTDGWTVAGTYAIFRGTARQAAQSVEAGLRDAITAHGGRSAEYRSLIAVKNKLGRYLADGNELKVTELQGRQPKAPKPKADKGSQPKQTSYRSGEATIRNVRVPDSVWEAAKSIAELRHETLSAVMVAALRQYAAAGGADPDRAPQVRGQEPLLGLFPGGVE